MFTSHMTIWQKRRKCYDFLQLFVNKSTPCTKVMQNFGFFSLTAKQGQGTETKLRVNYPFFVPVTGVT